MKYFVRILAFLFIGFSFGFGSGSYITLEDARADFEYGKKFNVSLRPVSELLFFVNTIHSSDDIRILGINTSKSDVSYLNATYYFKNPLNNKIFSLPAENLDGLNNYFYRLTEKDFYVYRVDNLNSLTNISVFLVDRNGYKVNVWDDKNFEVFHGFPSDVPKYYTIIDSYDYYSFSSIYDGTRISLDEKDSFDGFCLFRTYYIFNGKFCSNPNQLPLCSDKERVYSEKLGKCVPACPEGAYYNSFSDECTSTCDNVSNREERFDCLCKERGFGGYKSSIVSKEFVITNTPNGATDEVLYTGSIYCSTGELNSGDVSDYLKNKGYDDKDLKQSTSDFFEINDVIDKDNSSDSGSSDGTGDGSGGGEQGSTEPMTPEQQQQEQDRNECKAIVAAITADFSNYIQKYVNNGIDCSDSNAVQLARDAKSTIEMKVQTYNQSKCATAYHRINVTVPVHSCKTDPTKPDPIEPPAPQNPSDTIKYDENTNTVTITDSAGNTQAVTPTDVTKNDKDELQTIKYTDPETGKTIEYKVKEDGTWERVEYPGQGTGTGTNPSDKESGTGQGDGKPGGSSEGEGAGTSEDGKKDGNEDGEGNFEGGEFGALGNANDFDKGGELASLYDSLSEKESENNGILDSIISDGFGLVNDIKQSIDNIKETAEDLKNNPFSSSSVTSCAIDLNILETSSQIDLCKYTSQFKALFSSIFFVFLNIVVGFAFFKILILLLINI